MLHYGTLWNEGLDWALVACDEGGEQDNVPSFPLWEYINPETADGILHQGEMPEAFNTIYRAYWYAPDYPELQGLDLTPGEPIELYPAP